MPENKPKTYALLLSRQQLHPCASTPWVKALVRAIEWVGSRGGVLLTSTGTTTWDMQVAAALNAGVPQRIHLPSVPLLESAENCIRLRDQFDLHDTDPNYVAILADENIRSKGERMVWRDRAICEEADVLVPVCVRRNGTMASLIREHRCLGKTVIEQFEVPCERRKRSLKYEIECSGVHLPKGYLVHWTRTNNGPWPGERAVDFYGDILRSDHYPRTAFDTLRNMLTELRLRASGRHMPADTPTVSFTAASPARFTAHMRWRMRYREMSFEPYGIGLPLELAETAGLHRVCYHPPGEEPEGMAPWACQSIGNQSDWATEEEFRCCGDLDLAGLPLESLVCFCRYENEAHAIQREFGVHTIALDCEPQQEPSFVSVDCRV